MDSLSLATDIIKIIKDKSGEDTVCLDLRGVSSVMDFLVISTGKADVHVKAIAGSLIDTLKKEKSVRPMAEEGLAAGTWACIDYGDVIVHIMRAEERGIYDLQAIWGGCPKVE